MVTPYLFTRYLSDNPFTANQAAGLRVTRVDYGSVQIFQSQIEPGSGYKFSTLCAFKDELLQSGYLHRGHRTWPAGVTYFSIISHGVSQEVVLFIHRAFHLM